MEAPIIPRHLSIDMAKYQQNEFTIPKNSFSSESFNTSEDMFGVQLQDAIPSARYPIPYQYHDYNVDGEVSITPIKSKRADNDDSSYNRSLSDKRTVTFDDMVDIQLLSPYSSVCNASNDTHESALSDSNNSNTISSYSFESTLSNDEESIETIVASDCEIPRGTLFDVPENKLARPEFSSMISLTKEKNKVEQSDLDLVNAVREKLNVNKTRVKVEEKAYKHLNRDEQQYKHLQGTEVSDDAVYKLEQGLSSRVNSRIYKKSSKGKRQEPDILEFMKPEFQKETGSYSVQSFANEQTMPKTVESTHAFDVYQYISSWEPL